MPPPEIDVHKNIHRVVAIVAPSPTDARSARQRSLLDAVRRECADREVVVVQIPGDAFAVLLVGKDGGEKRRWSTPVAVREIFGLIDAMPMRRAEVRARRPGGQA